MLKKILLFIAILTSLDAAAQKPKKLSSSEIYHEIQKLNFLGTALYIAAHPDDENTRLISYLANDVKARTIYLSLTRGDGGQNLIGPEIRELLGVIRSQELLAARRTDGGEQRFSRANDFGYSKHPDETLAIWDKEKVLHDVVLAIRQLKPDIIINRFDHRTPGTTHGHHTTSAIISVEAFKLANKKSSYPNQLNSESLWQPRRLFFNTSWWFYGSKENFAKADKSQIITVNTGSYYTTLGKSNNEIAALSRSQHKSQGFGSTGSRGKKKEHLELIEGDLPQNRHDLFDGINTTWSRVHGGEDIGTILYEVEKSFDFTNPAASVPQLVQAYSLISKLENTYWKTLKSNHIKRIIKQCLGLYFEAVANTNHITKGDEYTLNIEAINRSKEPVDFIGIELPHSAAYAMSATTLKNNEVFTDNKKTMFHHQTSLSSPYWLNKKASLGSYHVSNQELIGDPATEPLKAIFKFKMYDILVKYVTPIVFKTNDPVRGEVYKLFEVIPAVSVNLKDKVIIFNSTNAKKMTVNVTAGKDAISGQLQINVPKGWKVSPQIVPVSINQKGDVRNIDFTITPPTNDNAGVIRPVFSMGSERFSKSVVTINYNHIPQQTVLLPCNAKVVRLNLKKKGSNIGYIKGAGDVVPQSLEQIGYKVTIINPETMTKEELNNFNAVVMGVRAYNTLPTLKFKQAVLFEYVENGGNLVVQYNTSHRLKVDQLAPYTLNLSRDRVTNEFAEVRFIAPKHEVLHTPNKITSEDFAGWVQERGLYFPNEWGKEFIPILSMNDKGESPKLGSLLIARYGKGNYIYTGLSFFRELPAGISGAYRLFANLLSLENNN